MFCFETLLGPSPWKANRVRRNKDQAVEKKNSGHKSSRKDKNTIHNFCNSLTDDDIIYCNRLLFRENKRCSESGNLWE